MLSTLDVFQPEISSAVSLAHFSNMRGIMTTLEVSHPEIPFIVVRRMQYLKVCPMKMVLDVSRFVASTLVRLPMS